MIRRRQIITVLVGVLVLAVAVRADLMAVSPLDAADGWQAPRANTLTDLRPASPSTLVADSRGLSDLDSLPVGFLPHSYPAAGPTSETQPAQILTDRQNSLTLCLYALLGLGLCRSAPFVKKLHFSCIPDWYHSGGPFQIGHSFAICPDCLLSAPVFCFLQPDCEGQKVTPQYLSGAIAALLRKSQFTATTLASRGPPYRS